MTTQSVSEVEARFSKLRRSLDEGGYLESFGSDSLRLVEHLYNDLVGTTESLQKTLVEYAHFKKIAEELENGVLPFKEENVRLCKENSQLRLGIARAYEEAEDKARDPLSRLRELEDENNDLKLLVSQFAERVKKTEIESLEKTKRIRNFQEKELAPTVMTTAEKGRKIHHQTMEVDYFVPEACPQCIRLRNFVEYGKNSDRNPKTVDYIKLADSRIEALQLQLRSLKQMEKEHMTTIASLKSRVDTRNSEIEKLRDLIKVRPGGDGIRYGKKDKNCEIELKSAEMKLQILQLRNMELEEKLKKSIFQEHESYMLGKMPPYFGDRNLANIFLEKELDKYPSHDKMTLMEKLYYLEQQLSHCCKEKAILQGKLNEWRLQHQPSAPPPSKATSSVDIRAGKDSQIQIPSFSSNTEQVGNIQDRKIMKEEPKSAKFISRKLSEKSHPSQAVSTTSSKTQVTGGRSGSRNTFSNKPETGKKASERLGGAPSHHEETKGITRKTAKTSETGVGIVSENENGVGHSDGEELEMEESERDTIYNRLNGHDKHHTTAIRRKPEKDVKRSGNIKLTRTNKPVSQQFSEELQEADRRSEGDTEEYSSAESSSNREDVNANRSLETFDNTNNDRRKVNRVLSSTRVASKTTDQPLLQHRTKLDTPMNTETKEKANQPSVGRRSDLLKTRAGKHNGIAKSRTGTAVTDPAKDSNRASQSHRPGNRDTNAKVKSTISSRGNGKRSSSVITTAARVEDFDGAFHERMEVSDEEEYLEEDLGDAERMQDDGGDYEEEEFTEEGHDSLRSDKNWQHQEGKPTQREYIDESFRSRSRQHREDAVSKHPRANVVGVKPQRSDKRSKENVRESHSKEGTRDGQRGAPETYGDKKLKAKKLYPSNKPKSVLVEDDEQESDGSVVSYRDDDDDAYADDVVADQNLMRQQKQSYQPSSERHGQRIEDPSVNNGNARGSKSDSRLLQQASSSKAPGNDPDIVRGRMDLNRTKGQQLEQSSNKMYTGPPAKGPSGPSSQADSSDVARSHGISAVQEPSLLSISEFEKENSDYEAAAQRYPSNRRQEGDRRVRNEPNQLRYDSGPQINPEEDIARGRGQQRSSYRELGEGDQPNKVYANPYQQRVEKDARQEDREIGDIEFGRGRGGGDATSAYATASDSSQSRKVVRDIPGFPMLRKSNSQQSQEIPTFQDDRNLSGFNVRERIVERGHALRSTGVNTDESCRFGLSWDTKMDDSKEKKQLLDKLTTLQRKMEEIHEESSRHQLKSFELQGELERTKHMLQIEKQERELAASELRRAQDRNSEASARLLMNSSLGSDPLRRGATPMEMEREVMNLRAALASLDRDKDEMRVELDRKDERLARVMQESSQYVDELSQLKLRLKNADLQLSHTGESAKEQSREAEFLKKQLESNRRDLEKIIRERDEAQKELHKISGAHVKGQMERRNVESELELKSKEADDLRKQVQRYIDEVRRIEELLLDKEEELDMLIQHYRSLTVENSNLEVQRTNLEKEASSIRDSVKDAVDQNIGFKTQLASQNSLVQSLEEEIQRFTQQISQLENQLASKAEKEEMLLQESKASKDLLYRLEVQMDKLKLDLADSDSKRKQLEVENAELAAHIASLETRLHDETERQQQLETLVANSREQDFQNERSTLNVSRERDELAEKLTSLQQRSESLNGEVSRYRLKSIELQNELDRTRRQLDTEKRDRESAIAELRRAREQLHSSSANYLLKSALGSSGLQSEGSVQHSGQGSSASTFRQNLLGSGEEGRHRSSREPSPFTTPHTFSGLQLDTPPNATSTSRYDTRSEDPSLSTATAAGSSADPPPTVGGNVEGEGMETWNSQS